MRPVRPILVCMSWRGGARLQRCLESIAAAQNHFERIVVSTACEPGDEDVRTAERGVARIPTLEVISPGREVPTMEHQAFWIDYLLSTGAGPGDWVYWLAYDDQVRRSGIDEVVDAAGNWPLHPGTAYFGPWAMRHEGPDDLWHGDPTAPLESWTSFPLEGPTILTAARWVSDQFIQPTYMQMSGSVNQLQSFIDLRDRRPRKRGPMRIEMAIATSPTTRFVQEFPTPVSIIYGRPNSDRASYGRSARSEDFHLAAWLARYAVTHPASITQFARGAFTVARSHARRKLPKEDWRVRGCVPP